MMRAIAKTSTGPLIVAGLSEDNIARLKTGQPIKASLRSFGADVDGSLVIFYGKTEADMERDCRRLGLIDEKTQGSVDPRMDQMAEAREHHAKRLICTVGLPRSGKTTWGRSQAYPIVCPDAIRLAVHGQRYVDLAEPFVWAIAKAMVRALFLAGHDHVILDATGITRKRRDEWRSPDWGTFFKYIDTPESVCLDRAMSEKDDEIVPVIQRMAAQFEPLGEDELRW